MTTLRRIPSVAAGVFFCGYLLFQIVYPMLPWFLPGFGKFTWQMFSARDDDLRFAVIFADGSRRDVGRTLHPDGPVRVLGASLDQRRHLPPWLCASWEGADRVVLRDLINNSEVVLPCRQFVR